MDSGGPSASAASVGVRRVSATLELTASTDTAYAFAVTVAAGAPVRDETLRMRRDGEPVGLREVRDRHGARLHLAELPEGRIEMEYRAIVDGRAVPAGVDPLDTVVYLRPSRYCESDALAPEARQRFGALAGAELVFAVVEWVHRRLDYVPEASDPIGGARGTLESGAGVCRDYAHLVIGMLRALDVPARMVAVYAPGLTPMDFHAVVEALVDGRWYLFDATRLAPRRTMVRIATGRDAADTAFLTTTLGDIELTRLEVAADADELPVEDPTELVELG